jgi:hypothetical protein
MHGGSVWHVDGVCNVGGDNVPASHVAAAVRNFTMLACTQVDDYMAPIHLPLGRAIRELLHGRALLEEKA